LTPGALDVLLENNRRWAEEVCSKDPHFFSRLARQQAPKYLWIGCSDSRVPATTIIGLDPGEVFVHRNVGNLVKCDDLNCLAVMQFAVEFLKVEHVIICGHYGCASVQAALSTRRTGLSDVWLHQLRELSHVHDRLLGGSEAGQLGVDKLCELNVVEQVFNACRTAVIQDAWRSNQQLSVHGLIYGLHDGRLRDLDMTIRGPDELVGKYWKALASRGAHPLSTWPSVGGVTTR
jgi:carbonic anhydrase